MGWGEASTAFPRRKQVIPLHCTELSPWDSVHFPPLLGKMGTLNLPLIAGHVATAWETFFLFVMCRIQKNILMALSPDRLHIPSEVRSTPPTPALGDGGTTPLLPTPFADPAPGRRHRDTSTSLCQGQAPGTARSAVQKPQSAKELKQAHC